MSKGENLRMAEHFFNWFMYEPGMKGLEARSYFYLFKWAGYRE